MNETYTPVPGHWYINRAGKLLRVCIVAYSGKQLCSVLTRDVEGRSHVVDIDDWSKLDLVIPYREQGEVCLDSEQGY